ncbi:MAG: hypothetical protein VR69_10860 [Peptococcaceae bacterium BRH_c4b]|nr:MAG: hypothetical protein VR69_10860 [Peptococcaceae bacterium BRH_c4b]
MESEGINLIKMEPSRKKPKEGDVFVIQPEKGLYYLGRVIRTNISSKDPFVNGSSLIYIYDNSVKSLEIPSSLANRELLIPPQIVNNLGWVRGYFKTIGNLPVLQEDLLEDYGFWDVITQRYVDEEGKVIAKQPKVIGSYALGSYGSVSYKVSQVLRTKKSLN